MRNYEKETQERVAYIRRQLEQAHCRGIVFGNSGGKDSALVGILCRMACEDVLGVMMPCHSQRNFGEDMQDAQALAQQYGIQTQVVDLTPVRQALLDAVSPIQTLTDPAVANIAPRLRITTLYSIAQSRGALVAGTGNRSERYMGYFTKWGDGAFDLNPIADLTVTEIYEFLRYLKAPENIITKAPSAGLFEGQTDEVEMGVTYEAIDRFLFTGEADPKDQAVIERAHRISQHKRRMASVYPDQEV